MPKHRYKLQKKLLDLPTDTGLWWFRKRSRFHHISPWSNFDLCFIFVPLKFRQFSDTYISFRGSRWSAYYAQECTRTYRVCGRVGAHSVQNWRKLQTRESYEWNFQPQVWHYPSPPSGAVPTIIKFSPVCAVFCIFYQAVCLSFSQCQVETITDISLLILKASGRKKNNTKT